MSGVKLSEVEVSFVVEKVGWRVAVAIWSEAGGRGKGRHEAAKNAPGGSKKASRASKLHPGCPAKMPCREFTNGHAESSRAGGGVPPKGKAIIVNICTFPLPSCWGVRFYF